MTRSNHAKRRLVFGNDNIIPATAEKDETKAISEKVAVAAVTVAAMATPEKKRQRRDDRDEGIAMYFSPASTAEKGNAKDTSVVVTPDRHEKMKQQEQQRDASHVPVYIHKNVNYQRRGQAFLSKNFRKVFAFIEEHYVIPSNFESDPSYGPLSGTCFEVRVVEAYERGLLSAKDYHQSKIDIIICSNCADLGHGRDDCPKLI